MLRRGLFLFSLFAAWAIAPAAPALKSAVGHCLQTVQAPVLAAALEPALAESPILTRDPAELGVPFVRYTTVDTHGRTITFYLSKPPQKPAQDKLPVVLWVEGSGCQSLFSKRGDKIGVGLHGLILQEAQNRFRVLAVEKPGVHFLDDVPQPGTAEGAREEFLLEHTLPRWAEANAAALRAVWTLPEIDASRTLTMGHSEGGIVAARVAAELPQVTHVASLAGGGPTQLFSLVEMAGQPRDGDQPDSAANRRMAVYQEWAKIQADPDSITQFWMAHPFRRWSTFMSSSLLQELKRSQAKIYLVHGTEDAATPITSFDVAQAELATSHRAVTAERIEGGDHGFRTSDHAVGSPDGLIGVFHRVLAWFHGKNGEPGSALPEVAPPSG